MWVLFVQRFFRISPTLCRDAEMKLSKLFPTQHTVEKWRSVIKGLSLVYFLLFLFWINMFLHFQVLQKLLKYYLQKRSKMLIFSLSTKVTFFSVVGFLGEWFWRHFIIYPKMCVCLLKCSFFCGCLFYMPAVRCAGELLHGRGSGLQPVGRNHQIQRQSPDSERLQQLLSCKSVPSLHYVS